jgi:hypothetical protein
MGLFDLFRRKSEKDVTSMMAKEPRCAHYMFAHFGLRQAALEEPLFYLAALASPDREKLLESVFESVVEFCRQRENTKPDFTVNDLQVHCTRLGSFPCAIVEMPTPVAITEVYFTALVVLKELSVEMPRSENVPARYFTLELGFNVEDSSSRTVLGEWSKDSHSNYGDGPAPTVDGFTSALTELLKTAS